MSEPTHILWLDLETTGVQSYSSILEIAVVVTDFDLNEKMRKSYVVNPDATAYERDPYQRGRYQKRDWVREMPLTVVEMHAQSRLLRAVESSITALGEAEADLIPLIKKACGKKAVFPIPLGGSGVSHFDLQVIKAQMPLLAALLTYWTIDVGNVRRFAARLAGVEFERGTVEHRAMADVDQSIEEAKRLRTLIGGTK